MEQCRNYIAAHLYGEIEPQALAAGMPTRLPLLPCVLQRQRHGCGRVPARGSALPGALELVGAYWLGKDFSAVSREEYEKLVYPGYAEIGTWMYPDAGGELYYFFGPEVKSRDTIPAGMVAIDVPEAEYAVVTVPKAADAKGLRENVKAAWKFIFNDWFDTSAYKFDESKMGFEMYLGEDTFIYVPVLKKQTGLYSCYCSFSVNNRSL